MLPRIPKFFNFELHQSRRDRLRLVFKPRLELLEHRLAPSVNVSSPGDQTTAEGAFPTPTFNMGSFTDDNAIGNPWRVTVMWGDGTTSPFTVNQQGSLGTQRHNYGEEGVFPVTITVTDNTGVTGSTNFNISVFDPPVSVSAVNFATVNSMALNNQVVATFTDPGKPEPNANDPAPLTSHYSATIDWGDFSGSTPATITLSGSVFTVTGNHTYAQPNTYQTTVTVFHESAPASSSTGTANVSAAPLVVTTPGDQVTTEGNATSFSLGSFSDTTANATSWRVDVNWGDNTAHTVYTVPSQGTLGNQPHSYGEEGTYVVTVTVTDNLNQAGAANFNVTVADPAVNASGINFSGVSNSNLTNQAVATFTDPGGAEPNASDPNGGIASHYSATIDWGDFSGATAGTITLSNGVFTISGSHSYTGSGTFPINVTITHEGAPQTFAQGQAIISTNPVAVSSAGDQVSTEGTATSFNLGSFSDTATGANSWRVDINWGDNTAHTTFTTNSQGALGSRLHTYGEEGIFPVTVTITDNLNQTGSTTFNASVADPAVSASATSFAVASNTAFTHAVATFTDPGGAEPNASDPNGGVGSHYSASIDWGDFSGSSTGTITLSNGVFTVNGSHNYSGSGTFPINVTISHEGAPPTFVQGQVSVSSNPVLVSSPGDQFATEGSLVSFTLGSFSDSTPNANSWRVDVNWGDNTAHTAFTTNTPGSLGNQLHTYGEEGVYPVVVTVTDNQNQTGSASFNVTAADLPVTASAANSTAFLNTAFSNQVVATFNDPAGVEPNASDPTAGINNHYSATIDWGDGSGAMPGTITFNNGAFTISGGHTYTQIGTFTTTVTINHETASPTVVTGMINVTSSPLLVTAPANQSSVEGASNNFSLGTFKDSTTNASPWRVDVNWGDNTAHTTFTTSTQGSLGNRPHIYGEEGTYTVTITVTDNQNVTGSASYQVTVSDPPVIASATNFSASSNSAFTNQVVATFTDPAGAEPNASDPVPGISSHYSASIDWGDGTGTSAGTITFANGVFTVTGSHTYVSTGDFITTVFLNHENAPQTTPQGSATVGVSAIVVTTAGNQTASEGASLLFNLGSFSDMTNATAWQVDVNWGDNTPHTTFNLNSQGTLGTSLHTYGEEGVYIVTETVTNNANMSAASTFQVSVSDPAVVGSAANFSAPSNSAFTQPVATFTDPGGAEPNASDPNGGIASHYSATIDWGDFSGATAGTISFANGVFTVTGSHTYTGNGTFATTVTIVHEGAPQTVIQGSATVGTTNVAVSSPGNQTAVEGAVTSFNLGSFSDVTSNATSWTVDVNWGDGTADTIFTTGSQGALGSQVHTYGEEGNYTARITVTDNQNQAGSATFQVTVTDPAVVGSAVNFSANANSALTNQPVAVFTDPGGAEPNAADPIGTVSNHYTANINWGDNTAPTTGTITLSGNTFAIQGGHTYSSGGTFTTTITILHEGAPLTTLTGTASVSGTTTGLINFVNFETGDFSQTAAHQAGAIVSSPALDGRFSLQLFRNNSVAWAEIRQSGSTFYNLPTAFYSFQFQYASQTGEGGIINFQDASGNFKAALHLSPSGKLQFFDANGNLVATGTTTLVPNQTYTISAKIGTGANAPFQILVNGNVELNGTANLGNGNNGSIRLGGNSAYTTNYYYDDVAIAANGFPVTGALTVTAPSNQSATAGTAASFNLGSFSDTTPGASSWTVTVNWGDNTSPTTFTTNSQGSLGSQPHTYAQAGNYTATVTVTDNQNASASASFQVTVSPSSTGLINFVNFETGDFSQTAAHQGGAIVTSPTLSGGFALQLLRNNSVAWAEIRQNGSTFYNLPTAFYSFQFQYASQTGAGGIVNFQDANGNYKAALHLSPSGQLQFFDANGNLVATGTTTLVPNQTYTISAKIGTGANAPFQILVNGNVELSGTANLGAGNNGSIRLGGNSAYTTNYYYDNIAIAANGFPGTTLTVTAPANQTATAGTAASFNLGSFSDTTSGASSWTVTVNWGDNSSPTTFTTNSQGSLGSQSHTYAQAGNYTATVTVTDNQNVSGSATFQVTVSPSNIGLVNFVNFETGDFSQTAAHLNGAIVTSPALDGHFSLQLFRSNSVAWAEIRQNSTTFYNLPTAFYSFQFQYASQTGAGGIINFQDANGNYKAALHLSPSGQLQFFDANGNLVATGTTTLVPNQTYTISAKIGTGTNAPFEVRINGNVELSGTANLGGVNNGSIRLGGNSAYTTNYYYDDVAIAANGYPGGNAPPPGGAATLVAGQHQAVSLGDPAGMVLAATNGSDPSGALPLVLTDHSLPVSLAGQDSSNLLPNASTDLSAPLSALDSVFADWANA